MYKTDAEAIEELEAALEGKESEDKFFNKDAERYQWIKNNLNNDTLKLPPLLYLDNGDGKSYDEPSGKNIDCLIDALMQRKIKNET